MYVLLAYELVESKWDSLIGQEIIENAVTGS